MQASERVSVKGDKLVVREVRKALRLTRKYSGKFSRDEFEYAQILLDELDREKGVK